MTDPLDEWEAYLDRVRSGHAILAKDMDRRGDGRDAEEEARDGWVGFWEWGNAKPNGE